MLPNYDNSGAPYYPLWLIGTIDPQPGGFRAVRLVIVGFFSARAAKPAIELGTRAANNLRTVVHTPCAGAAAAC